MGQLNLTTQVAPSAPGSGIVALYADSADGGALKAETSAGAIHDLQKGKASIVANAAATNATTNLSIVTDTIRANSAQIGTVYRLTGWGTFLHTAAATPTLTLEVLINGAVVDSAVVTPQSTAATFDCEFRALLTFRTTGPAGTVMINCRIDGNGVLATGNDGSANTATDAVDTTVDRSIELRVRMTTAVAANTLSVTQGLSERVFL